VSCDRNVRGRLGATIERTLMRELNYLDFDLVVERAGPGTYRARVTDAPAGETAPAQFAVPFSDLEIDNFLLRIGRPRRAPVRGEQSMEAAAVRDFGGRLFDAVFRDELRVALATSLDRAESRDAGLRLRLRFSDAPELADLPWEYLYDRGARRFLALSEWTPVVRYLEFPGRVRPLAVQPPLRVLVLIASPSDFPGLDVDAEWEKLNEALGDLQRAGRVEVHRMPTGTLADLQRQLRRNDYHVFHFVGHGGYDAQADDGVLVLEGANRRGQQVSGQDLGVLLHDHRTLRLAVLNSCEGARGGRTDPYSGTAQSLVRQGIPAVVAMQFEITDTAAITLTRSLYEAVADGYPLDAAMAEARKAVRHEPNPVEWGTPVLYLRAPDGRIFNLPAGSSLAGAADSTTPRASVATAETIIEPSDDPDYTAALAAYFTERWDTAVELFTRVLAKYPEHRPAAERLAEAQRHQQLAQWDTEAREAAEQGRWEVAVAALERLHAAQPDRSDVQQQLEHARAQEKIAALQADLRRLHDARQWQAVVAVGEQLAEIDPQLADQNGLVSSAKTELAEKALADRYRSGLLQLDRGDRVAAAETFSAIEAERPSYRDAAALLARARERPAEPEQQPATAQRAPAPPRPALPPETPSPSRGEPTDSRIPASTPTRTPQSERPPASPQPPPDAASPLPAAPAPPARALWKFSGVAALVSGALMLLCIVLPQQYGISTVDKDPIKATYLLCLGLVVLSLGGLALTARWRIQGLGGVIGAASVSTVVAFDMVNTLDERGSSYLGLGFWAGFVAPLVLLAAGILAVAAARRETDAGFAALRVSDWTSWVVLVLAIAGALILVPAAMDTYSSYPGWALQDLWLAVLAVAVPLTALLTRPVLLGRWLLLGWALACATPVLAIWMSWEEYTGSSHGIWFVMLTLAAIAGLAPIVHRSRT
jgi:tetratricopeptide (TPR) repeat protein